MDEIRIRPCTKQETLYAYRQSEQIQGQTGCIGYLRADMDTDGNGFFSNWTDLRKYLKTDKFKDEFDNVINALRKEGNILFNRKTLANYCYSTPKSKMENEQEFYAVRTDTDEYAYIMRLNPNRGDYNLYCYCYRKDFLERHMRLAESGIRFVNTKCKCNFLLEDGGKIVVESKEGKREICKCRYIDDYHFELGHYLNQEYPTVTIPIIYHIFEFAENCENKGWIVEPLK